MAAFPPALVLAARVLGIPALAGINLYLTVFALGIIKKLTGAAVLGAEFEVFASWPVLIVAGVFTLAEVIADKVPAVDHVWDAVHTFIRTPGAMVVVAVVTQGQEPAWQVVAVLVAGVASFATHSGKATLRLASTKGTAAVANAFISLAEDAVVGVGAWLAAYHPLILGALALVAFAALAFFAPKFVRAIRISWAFSFNFIRYLCQLLRRWLDADWRPASPPVALPAGIRGLTWDEEPRAVARVVVGKFGRRRFGFLILWRDRLTVVVRRAFRRREETFYFKEVEDVAAAEWWTMGRLFFRARGREYQISFFKGRVPKAGDVALAIARGQRAL